MTCTVGLAAGPARTRTNLGALDVVFTLREEFATWVEEAHDESAKDALENVQRHVVDMEAEFQRRREEIENKLKSE